MKIETNLPKSLAVHRGGFTELNSPSMGFSRQEYWSGVPLPSLRLALEKSKIHNLTLNLNNNKKQRKLNLKLAEGKKY